MHGDMYIHCSTFYGVDDFGENVIVMLCAVYNVVDGLFILVTAALFFFVMSVGMLLNSSRYIFALLVGMQAIYFCGVSVQVAASW
eukprot:c13818_g1_i1 orf=128-382(+)